MKTIDQLLEGYQRFYKANFTDKPNISYTQAEKGQSPRVMMISCCDSRVDPATITQAGPGELFITRNVANLVPPCHLADGVEHGTISALEYAVCHLHVSDIVIMGHSSCGGIRALLDDIHPDEKTTFIPDWLAIASEARSYVLKTFPNEPIEVQAKACERASLNVSLKNLMTYPWIQKAVKQKKLTLHTWHFSISLGHLEQISKLDFSHLSSK